MNDSPIDVIFKQLAENNQRIQAKEEENKRNEYLDKIAHKKITISIIALVISGVSIVLSAIAIFVSIYK
jgi:hypothetical protein